MDGSAAIERNRVALQRIVASLIAMAGLGDRQSAIGNRQSETGAAGASDTASPTADCRLPTAPTLPRHLWRAILCLLRPAEAAARRLIIAAARGLVVPPPQPRAVRPKPRPQPRPQPKPEPVSAAPLLRSLGIAVVVSSAQIAEAAAAARREEAVGARTGRFLPCEAGGEQPVCRRQIRRAGGTMEGQRTVRARSALGRIGRSSGPFEGLERPKGKDAASAPGTRPAGTAPRIPAFALLDPLRDPLRKRRRTTPPHAAPRIWVPGVTEPYRRPPPPSPDDEVSAAGLGRRLAALAAALDDLPGQARRFARWKARGADAVGAQNREADAAGAQNEESDAERGNAGPRRFRRIWPLRSGPPPGGRLAQWDPYIAPGPQVSDRAAPGARRRKRAIREIDVILAHAHELACEALTRPDTS